jgi:hypothetical protein
MNDKEWTVIRLTLEAGWVPPPEGLNESAYRGLLSRYPIDEVQGALHALMGRGPKYIRIPKVSEIIAAIPSRTPEAQPLALANASDELRAKYARLDILDEQETARRDAELDEWWENDATEGQKAAGEAWLAAHGYSPITEEKF